MLQHFSDYFFQLLEQKLLECLVILGIFRLGVERSDIFLLVPVLEVLRWPIYHKNGLKEWVGRLCDSWDITAHKDVDGKLDDWRQLSTWQDDAGVVEEESLVHAHIVIEKVAEAWNIGYFVHMVEGNVAEVRVNTPQKVVVFWFGWKYRYCDLNQVDVGAYGVLWESWQHCCEEVFEELGKMKFHCPHDHF